jgi:glycosyltransferase involved in cell wall biosynthesis
MHVLFVHQNYPAQFGHLAQHLAERHGYRTTFVSEKPSGRVGQVEMVQYSVRGGATHQTHFCSRTFENAIWHSSAVYDALKARPDLRPDLIVGHSGFGSTLFLREMYSCPIINYFEYYYRTTNSDLDFRRDFPVAEPKRLRARARNAMILLDLDNCDLGYCPTGWQRDRFPPQHHPKLRVVFDGVDTGIWRPRPGLPRRLGDRTFPDDVRIVTYVSRGFESMRGFDVFMRAAQKICERRRDAVFLVVGQDRVCYGGDAEFTGGKSFKDWVLSQGTYDLSRFIFPGLLPAPVLAEVLSFSDLHVYLTVPFVLSWSLIDALACGATVLASDTAPVREVIEHGRNGLLADFFDADGIAELANQVLDQPREFKHLGAAGVELVRQRYSLEVCLPQIRSLYEEVASASVPSPSGRGLG